MPLENVINEIISQAEKQKQEIIDQAKQEAEKIIGEATNKGKEQAKHFEEETKKIIAETKRMEISASNIHLHKMFLEAKKNILDEIFNQVIEKLSRLDSSKRRDLIHELVEKAKDELPDAKFVYCNDRDKEIASGIKSLKFKGVIDCLGGVVVENTDETIRVNYTFNVLLQTAKEMYINEISKRIFQS